MSHPDALNMRNSQTVWCSYRCRILLHQPLVLLKSATSRGLRFVYCLVRLLLLAGLLD